MATFTRSALAAAPPTRTGLATRFAGRRRAARGALGVTWGALAALLSVALFAEVLAPVDARTMHVDFAYAPPQALRLSFEHGLHVYALERRVASAPDGVVYVERSDRPLPIRLLPSVAPYRLWGVVSLSRRLWGVDRQAVAAVDSPATFFALGTDDRGRDLLGRALLATRASLLTAMASACVAVTLAFLLGWLPARLGGAVGRGVFAGVRWLGSLPAVPLCIALMAAWPRGGTSFGTFVVVVVALGLSHGLAGLPGVGAAWGAGAPSSGGAGATLRRAGPWRGGWPGAAASAWASSVPRLLLGETALGFVGWGLEEPLVSWGSLLHSCFGLQAVRSYPWLLTPAAFAVGGAFTLYLVAGAVRTACQPQDGAHFRRS